VGLFNVDTLRYWGLHMRRTERRARPESSRPHDIASNMHICCHQGPAQSWVGTFALVTAITDSSLLPMRSLPEDVGVRRVRRKLHCILVRV
jgi:hypothetical protein